jgi:uncharacterized protein
MNKSVSPQVTSLSASTEQVWRNGGGTTRELLTRNQPGSDDWQYRISVAEVNAAGPFSYFEGTQRHFCVLTGHGVDLTIDGVHHRVTKHSNALSFSGEAKVECSLIDGPTSDLNFMVRTSSESKLLSGMTPLKSGIPSALSAVSSAGIFSLQDGLCQWWLEGQTFELPIPANHLVWFDSSPEEITFMAYQAAATITDPLQTSFAWSMFVCLANQHE